MMRQGRNLKSAMLAVWHSAPKVLFGALIASLCCPATTVRAQEVEQVVAKRAAIDWVKAAGDARGIFPGLNGRDARQLFGERHENEVANRLQNFTIQEGMLPLARLSELMSPAYPGVTTVPIPVLAPVAVERLLDTRSKSGENFAPGPAQFLNRSVESIQLIPGLTGYDLLATASSELLNRLKITVSSKPIIEVAGTFLTYGEGEQGTLVEDLQDRYPGVRRLQGTEEITYAFRKYGPAEEQGASYFVNVGCSEVPPNENWLTCEQADSIIRAVLDDLRLIGGGPVEIKEQPDALRPFRQEAPRKKAGGNFKYHAPGSLLPGSSATGNGGAPTRKIHGTDLRFPIKDAPVFANSQIFMHWGSCLGKREALPRQPGDKFDRYRCKQNPAKELLAFEGHRDNYSYPWFDNYCEARARTGAHGCPDTKGHEGQDLRPASCIPDQNKARCKIDVHDAVAVSDGFALWKLDTHLKLRYETLNNKLYFMYLHMSPHSLRQAGMVKDTWVKVTKGQPVGKVGNYLNASRGATSTHLHFEIRLGPNIGVPHPPYWTLVDAYQRLLEEQGEELP